MQRLAGGAAMRAVEVRGSSPAAAEIAAAIQAQPDLEIGSGAGVAAVVDPTPERPAPGDAPVVYVGPVAGARPFHGSWGAPSPFPSRVWVPVAPLAGTLRVLRRVPGIRRAALTVVAPAGVERPGGPVDALVPEAVRHAAGFPLGEAVLSVTAVTAPHTRHFLVGCSVDTAAPLDGDPADLLEGRRTMIAPAGVGLRDTATLFDYFRDLHRPGGRFWETVVFGDHVTTGNGGRRLEMWLAVHHAGGALEVVDALRLTLGMSSSAEDAATATDACLPPSRERVAP